MKNNIGSIYAETGAVGSLSLPYVVVGTCISNEHIDAVERIFSTLQITKDAYEIKKVPKSYYMEVQEAVYFINKRTYPKAIRSWMEVIRKGQVYTKGTSISVVEAVGRVSRCMDIGCEVHLRCSSKLPIIKLPLVHEKGVCFMHPTMIVALSLAKLLKKEL
jgi:hypothetical protein